MPNSTLEATVGGISPEIGEGQPEEHCTILDWLKAFYQPPPIHSSTLNAFEVLGLEYISTFKVAEEVPLYNIGHRTDDLRFELLFFQKDLSGLFSYREVYPFSGTSEWVIPPFPVSKSRIQGYGVFFEPSEKEKGEIMEDSILFPYGGMIHLRSNHLGNFHFETIFFLKVLQLIEIASFLWGLSKSTQL